MKKYDLKEALGKNKITLFLAGPSLISKELGAAKDRSSPYFLVL